MTVFRDTKVPCSRPAGERNRSASDVAHLERPVNTLDKSKLDEYLALIDKKIDAAGGRDWPMSGGPHPWSSLNDAERITITAYFFALDVSNGEFKKWFIERGDTWREALYAIKTVGATRLAEL